MPRPAPSIGRVVSLMNLLGENPGEFLTLSTIARRLSLNKATAHGILTALTDATFVMRHPEDNGYSLGPGIVRVGRAALSRGYEIAALARHEMETLAEETHAQCIAMAVDSNQIIVIASAGAPAGSTGTYLGQRGRSMPPFGMVFMAWASEDEIERWLTAEPLEDEEREHYRDFLREVRERGFSASTLADERPRIEAAIQTLLGDVVNQDVKETLVGLMSELARETTEITDIQARPYRLRQISAPVFDENGVVQLGLALTGLQEISGQQVREYGYALTAAASRVTRLIGGHPPELTDRDAVPSEAPA